MDTRLLTCTPIQAKTNYKLKRLILNRQTMVKSSGAVTWSIKVTNIIFQIVLMATTTHCTTCYKRPTIKKERKTFDTHTVSVARETSVFRGNRNCISKLARS